VLVGIWLRCGGSMCRVLVPCALVVGEIPNIFETSENPLSLELLNRISS
jgi:hypothetical protein